MIFCRFSSTVTTDAVQPRTNKRMSNCGDYLPPYATIPTSPLECRWCVLYLSALSLTLCTPVPDRATSPSPPAVSDPLRGMKLASASSDRMVYVWEGRHTDAPHIRLIGHGSGVQSAAWSPDGTKVATASLDRTARVWDSVSGSTLLTLTGHTDNVYSVAWSPDGTKLATASGDLTARV